MYFVLVKVAILSVATSFIDFYLTIVFLLFMLHKDDIFSAYPSLSFRERIRPLIVCLFAPFTKLAWLGCSRHDEMNLDFQIASYAGLSNFSIWISFS